MTPSGTLLRRVLRKASRITRRRLPPRATNDYATHVPVLIGLGQLLRVRHVLEFGAGLYSTLTFLNEAAFPLLESLQSFESNSRWMQIVAQAAKGDDRLFLRLVAEPMEAVLSEISPLQHDLIFVDNSTDAAARASTIRALVEDCPSGCVVVIHDFEFELYRQAARGFAERFEFRQFNPCTGVLWHSFSGLKPRLATLRRVISQHRAEYPPDDVASWTSAFQSKIQPLSLATA